MADIIDRYGNYIKRIDDGILIFQFDVTDTKYTELDSSFIIYSDSAQRTLVNVVKNLVTDNTISYGNIGSFVDKNGVAWGEETFRDFLDSNTGASGALYLANISGWGVYSGDGTTTQTFDGDWSKLIIDGSGTVIEDYLPPEIRGSGHLFDTSTSDITPISSGDTYDFRLNLTITGTTSNPTRVDLVMDIGGGASPSIIVGEAANTLRTGTPQPQLFTFPFYSLTTFIANGGQFFVRVNSGTITVSTVNLFIERVSKNPIL